MKTKYYMLINGKIGKADVVTIETYQKQLENSIRGEKSTTEKVDHNAS